MNSSNEKIKNEVFFEILYAYSTSRDIIFKILNDNDYSKDEFGNTLYNLLKFITERGVTITILVQNNLLWDAQILMRCIQEATMKLCFLCYCDNDEKTQRLKEYLYDLDEINSLKRSDNAKKIVEVYEEDSLFTLQFKPFIFDSVKEEELRAKWNRQKKHLIEQKWSYLEMLRLQLVFMKPLEKKYLSLIHPYRLSSHLLHCDETGLGIVAERSLRNDVEKEKIESSHFASLLMYSLDYLILCGQAVAFNFKIKDLLFEPVINDMQETYRKIAFLQNEVFENDNSYDKFRK